MTRPVSQHIYSYSTMLSKTSVSKPIKKIFIILKRTDFEQIEDLQKIKYKIKSAVPVWLIGPTSMRRNFSINFLLFSDPCTE